MSQRKVNLDQIKNSVSDEIEKDLKTYGDQEYIQEELADWEKGRLRALEEELRSLQQDREERKKYAKHIFILICVWLFIILLIIIAEGFYEFTCFDLDDTVLITLITTTTANVAAYFLVVTKYLFPNSKKQE